VEDFLNAMNFRSTVTKRKYASTIPV